MEQAGLNELWAQVVVQSSVLTGNQPGFPAVSICFLYLFFRNKQMFMLSSWVESRFLTALLLVPLVFKPAKRTHSPRGTGASDMWLELFTPQGRFQNLCNTPLFCAPSQRHKFKLTASFPFLSDSVCLFLTALVVKVFLSVSRKISVRIVPQGDEFLMCSCGEVRSVFSYSVILISQQDQLLTPFLALLPFLEKSWVQLKILSFWSWLGLFGYQPPSGAHPESPF